MSIEWTSGLRRAMRGFTESYGALVVAADGEARLRDDDMAALSWAVDVVNQRVGGEMSPQRVLVVSTPKGPAVVMFHVDREQATATLTQLSEAMSEQGVGSVRLASLPSMGPNRSNSADARMTKSWFVLRGAAAPGWTGPESALGWDETASWDVSREVLHQVVDQTLSWILDDLDPAAQVAISVQDRDVPVSVDSARKAAHLAIEGPRMLDAATVTTISDTRIQVVDIRPGVGLAAVSTGAWTGPSYEWSGELDRHIGWMSQAGRWVEVGAIVRIWNTANPAAVFVENAGRLGSSGLVSAWYDLARVSASGRFLDAFGVIRVSSETAAVLNFDGLWQTTELGGGDVLAVHHDRPAWYASDAVDEGVLDTARAALGEAALDRSGEQIFLPPLPRRH